jgi:hypothetical protein
MIGVEIWICPWILVHILDEKGSRPAEGSGTPRLMTGILPGRLRAPTGNDTGLPGYFRTAARHCLNCCTLLKFKTLPASFIL